MKINICFRISTSHSLTMVNTFCLDNDPKVCAKLLDYRRLGKQRVEAMQIIDAINSLESNDEKVAWKNHPAVKMWMHSDTKIQKQYLNALKYYLNCMIDEWVNRGYKNEMKHKKVIEPVIMPWWFTNKYIQLTHKCSLMRKDEKYYSFLETDETKENIKYGYIWPSHLTDKQVEKLKGKVSSIAKYCDPIGCGAPVQYVISKELAYKWHENKNVNPKTGRKISSTGKIYLDYKKAYKFYKG